MKRTLTTLAAAALGCAALASPAGAALKAVSPGTGLDNASYPDWYQDSTGQQLRLCDGALAQCPAPPLAGDPFEGFYSLADADFTGVSGAPSVPFFFFAVEAADSPDGPTTFGRVQYRIDGLADGAYTITHPYGVDKIDVSGGSTGRVRREIGCAIPPGACDFADALPTEIGPFLRWDPAIAPAAPAGFLGDYATPHEVVGSPNGTNFVRIQGPGVDVTTTKFTVAGRVNGPVTPLGSVERTRDFGSKDLGQTATQAIAVRNESTVAMPLSAPTISGAQSGDFAITGNTCGASVPAATTCAITVGFTPAANGSRTATLNAGLPAGSPTTSALSGTGTTPAPAPQPQVEQPAPIITPVTPAIDVSKLRASQVSFTRKMKVRTARSRGISVAFVQPVNATYVSVALYRLKGTKRVLVTRKRASAVAGLQRALLRNRRLASGNYVISIRSGLSSTKLGPEIARRLQLKK